MPTNWFSEVFGFTEKPANDAVSDRDHVLDQTSIDPTSTALTSLANGRVFQCGELNIQTISEFRLEAEKLYETFQCARNPSVSVICDDANTVHESVSSIGATIQVASQFNLLEMVSPTYKPSDGITNYCNDMTQGPVCAMACAAGTLYRNYYDQDDDNQVDCLREVGKVLSDVPLWDMKNGYCMITTSGSAAMAEVMASDVDTLNEKFDHLQVGVQYDTEVVSVGDIGHTVTQVYCSAIPLTYMDQRLITPPVKQFAEYVLMKSYEATVYAAAINALYTGNRDLYLTFVGGGAFGNDEDSIVRSIKSIIPIAARYNINIIMVCYSQIQYSNMTNTFNEYIT